MWASVVCDSGIMSFGNVCLKFRGNLGMFPKSTVRDFKSPQFSNFPTSQNSSSQITPHRPLHPLCPPLDKEAGPMTKCTPEAFLWSGGGPTPGSGAIMSRGTAERARRGDGRVCAAAVTGAGLHPRIAETNGIFTVCDQNTRDPHLVRLPSQFRRK